MLGRYIGINIKFSGVAFAATACTNKAFIRQYQGILVNFLNHKSRVILLQIFSSPQSYGIR